MENVVFLSIRGCKLTAFDLKAIKLVGNSSSGDVTVLKMAEAVKKKNWVLWTLFFSMLRCISNQKINEYWEIGIW